KWSILKALITDDNLTIEYKNRDSVTKKNTASYIFTSNYINNIFLEASDRRYLILNCSNEFKGNKAYFNSLASCCKNENILNSLYSYLLTINVGDLSILPKNKHKRTLIRSRIKPFELFLKYFIINNLKNHKLGKRAIYYEYQSFCMNYLFYTKKPNIGPLLWFPRIKDFLILKKESNKTFFIVNEDKYLKEMLINYEYKNIDEIESFIFTLDPKKIINVLC
ncbi:hypothetical protein KAU11_08485, partial [Candidatus Babeliales bacterium]|nr:hypothetical protein [Candidatus Babeliales bacterium]